MPGIVWKLLKILAVFTALLLLLLLFCFVVLVLYVKVCMSCSVCHKHVKKNHRKFSSSIYKNFVQKSWSDLTAYEFRRRNAESFWHCEIYNNKIMLPFNHTSDETEFKIVLFTLFEHQNIVNKEDIIEKYRNLIFDPHKFNDKDDFNEYNSNSDYYDNEQLKEVCKNIEKNDLRLLTINARSLYKNLESLQHFLGSIDIEFKIIGLVETWLKDQPQEYFQIRRVYHIVTDHAFWVESIVTYHRIYRKKCIT